ncbi:MAG: plastocyanin/azurin family copper-binding protein [Rhodothermales bacterium]
MRTLSNSFFALLFASLIMVGCGGESADTAAADDAAADATEEMAADAIVIEANDMLQFTVTEFTVTEGEEVTVVLKNVGQMAKEMGGHNIVFLTEGADVQAFGVAAAGAGETAYIPADMADWVMASSELLGPGEEATVTFTAPAAGTYEFVCSFPGHFGTMRGVMTVEAAM